MKPVNKSASLSIIIPCYNEEKYIEKCLGSIVSQIHDNDSVEVIVVDGLSTDATAKILMDYEKKYPFIRYIKNPRRITPVALNVGIQESKGDFILILGSHSMIGKDFIRKNIETLLERDVDCVGGVLETIPSSESLCARGIALALGHPFGVGNSQFRIGVDRETFVDTVPFGCYRREVFDKIGFFDEDLVRNQDDEFNLRLLKNNGKILLVPEITSQYFARDSFIHLGRMFFQYGYLKPLVALKLGGILTWRQTVPGLFIVTLLLSVVDSFFKKRMSLLFVFQVFLYSCLSFSCALLASKKAGEIMLIPFIFLSFIIIHFSYGFGYLCGVKEFLVFGNKADKKIFEMSLTR